MVIVKRLDPAERFNQRYGDTWRKVKHFPMIAALCNPKHVSALDVSPFAFSNMIDSFASIRWISEVPMDHKIFFYAVELVCDRANIPGFLPEDFIIQLKRHMNALSTIEKIDTFEGTSLPFRQTFVWEIDRFLARYPKRGTLALADPYATPAARKIKPKPAHLAAPAPSPKPPVKPLRKRLPKHR